MRGILAVLSVNVGRSAGRPGYVIMTVGLMLAAILTAVLIGSKVDGRGTIAYVAGPTIARKETDSVVPVFATAEWSQDPDAIGAPAEPDVRAILELFFRVETLDEVPPMSQLMRNRYDAVVVDTGNGRADIVTVKSDKFRTELEQALSEPQSFASDTSTNRGVGATIVGYLVMFVLMSGSAFMNFFTDDKVSGTFRRTVTAPIGIRAYLAGQLLFNGVMLFVPTMSVLILLKAGVQVDIGFSYPQYVLLIGLVTTLATAFGFFMASVIENPDDAMAVASSVIVVTSLLGGTLFVFEHDDAFMQVITRLLPQRSLVQIASGLEQGWSSGQLTGLVGHVVAVAFVLFIAGWIICERRFYAGRY